MNKLLTRTLSGLVYVALIVCACMLGLEGTVCLALLFGVLSVIEFSRITRRLERRDTPVLLLNVFAVIFISLSCFIFPLALWGVCWLGLLIAELYRKGEEPIGSLANSALVQLYIGVPLGLMVLTAAFPIGIYNSAMVILLLFCCLWVNDTGAFLTGSAFGKHKLFPRISPAKTWEGFFGGFILVLMACTLFWRFCPGFFGISPDLSLPEWLGLGAVISVFGTFGDLVESLFKRSLGIKDSGSIMPGHGGILDRIDSFLLAMPAMFLYFVLLMYIDAVALHGLF